MRPFAYAMPDTAAEAVALVAADPEAQFLGGGTNLVDLMRLGVARPGTLVDVTNVTSDAVTGRPDGGLLLGAAAPNAEVAADPRVRASYPMVSQALLAGASGQIRNAATIGGNLLQRTRCLYFTDATKPCNKRDPGSGCPARDGLHRDLAVLGHSEHCVATHPSDLAVALAACDAAVRVAGPDGERRVPFGELHRLPGADPSKDTTLAHGELVLGVELPPPAPLWRASAYRKARDRASFAFAVGSVAAALAVDDRNRVSEVRIALGAVAHRPWRALRAEQRMLGRPAKRMTFSDAMHAELAQAEPLRDNGFKVTLAHRLAVSVLTGLAAG